MGNLDGHCINSHSYGRYLMFNRFRVFFVIGLIFLSGCIPVAEGDAAKGTVIVTCYSETGSQTVNDTLKVYRMYSNHVFIKRGWGSVIHVINYEDVIATYPMGCSAKVKNGHSE